MRWSSIGRRTIGDPAPGLQCNTGAAAPHRARGGFRHWTGVQSSGRDNRGNDLLEGRPGHAVGLHLAELAGHRLDLDQALRVEELGNQP
jgi:hypothetical protein